MSTSVLVIWTNARSISTAHFQSQFEVIDIVIHVEDLIKTMSSQVEHLFRFQILK